MCYIKIDMIVVSANPDRHSLTPQMISLSIALLSASAMADRVSLIDYDDEWNLFSKFELSTSSIDDNDAVIGGFCIVEAPCELQ